MNPPLPPASSDPSRARKVVFQGSRLLFSHPGDSLRFGKFNYVNVQPNDGEGIIGATVIGDYLYVVKPSAMFIFYGVSSLPRGATMFNYRIAALSKTSAMWAPPSAGSAPSSNEETPNP